MAERYIPPQRNQGISRREFVAWGVGGALFLVGGAVGYFYNQNKNRPGQSPSSLPPLGVSGHFVGAKEGSEIAGPILSVTAHLDIDQPGTVVSDYIPTIWYPGARRNPPRPGWIEITPHPTNITKSGDHVVHIDPNEPEPGATPIPHDPDNPPTVSISWNARGKLPDGRAGLTEGVPGPINIIYRRTAPSTTLVAPSTGS